MRVSRRELLCGLAAAAVSPNALAIGRGSPSAAPAAPIACDVVIYGATPAGIVAAKAAMRQGASVFLIEPTAYIGGTYTGGISVTDSQDYAKIGGLSAAFFAAVGAHYHHSGPYYSWQPSVALTIFRGWLSGAGLTTANPIASVLVQSGRILSVTLSDGTVIQGHQFIDASYEGDLMALSGTDYGVGRESIWRYQEVYAGYGPGSSVGIFDYGFSAYANGSNGPLLYGVRPNDWELMGQSDQKYMTAGWRVILTNRATRLPYPMPPDYDPSHYAGVLRTIQELNTTTHAGLWTMSTIPCSGGLNYCTECTKYFSTDWEGTEGTLGWSYADADWTARSLILEKSRNRTMGFFYFLANDPSVPAGVRNDVNLYGLPPDEFTGNGGWPTQYYVREGRRMIGQYVMTEADVTTSIAKPDSIGVGQWLMDCHRCQRFVGENGDVFDEGMVFNPGSYVPYQVPFRSLLSNEVSNLAVPVCASCSHVAWMANRVEPLYMIQGEAAGVATALALEGGVDVSQVDAGQLQSKLTQYGAILA